MHRYSTVRWKMKKCDCDAVDELVRVFDDAIPLVKEKSWRTILHIVSLLKFFFATVVYIHTTSEKTKSSASAGFKTFNLWALAF